MAKPTEIKEQQHPLYNADRQILNELLQITQNPNNYQLVELARLTIRYRGFPGARDIQQDLNRLLNQWKLSEEALYEKTRSIHEIAQVYRNKKQEQEDWD